MHFLYFYSNHFTMIELIPFYLILYGLGFVINGAKSWIWLMISFIILIDGLPVGYVNCMIYMFQSIYIFVFLLNDHSCLIGGLMFVLCLFIWYEVIIHRLVPQIYVRSKLRDYYLHFLKYINLCRYYFLSRFLDFFSYSFSRDTVILFLKCNQIIVFDPTLSVHCLFFILEREILFLFSLYISSIMILQVLLHRWQ